MKTLLICLALFSGQMNKLQDKPVVHLLPHHYGIESGFGGKRLELINAPAEIQLPNQPPKLDYLGNPWLVDVKNLGPSLVTVTGKAQFSIPVNVGQTVHIFWNGSVYSLKQ